MKEAKPKRASQNRFTNFEELQAAYFFFFLIWLSASKSKNLQLFMEHIIHSSVQKACYFPYTDPLDLSLHHKIPFP
jgi:hypothetical protein